MPELRPPEPLAPRARDTARGRGAGSEATSPLGWRSFGLRSLIMASIGLVLGAQAAPAPAHFKWIGSDGTVNYGDSPPPDAGRIGSAISGTRAHRVPPPSAAPSAALAAPGGARLPYELRSAAQRHPVTLYTTTECPPCEQARAYLGQRGVPHEERSVRTGEDASAFRALGFAEPSFPALRVGTDVLIGFEPGGWNRALDVAGYPKTSQLPLNWKPAQARPLATAAVPGMATRVSGSEPTTPEGAEPTRREEAASATDAADTASSRAATQTSDTPIREARRRAALSRDAPTIRF